MTISDKYYEFSARDGMKIDGLATFNSNSKIALMFPGLTGQPQHYMFLKFRDELIKNGYDVFITNMYSSQEKNGSQPRALTQISMTRHIQDAEDVINRFSKKYENVYAIGHSLAGRMLLFVNSEKLIKQALIDPSSGFDNEKAQTRLKDNYKTNADGHLYIDWADGLFYPVGGLVDEFMNASSESIYQAVADLNIPTLFVKAGETVIALPYKFQMNANTRFIEIEGAGHTFWQYGVAENTISEVVKFFEE